MNVINQNAKTVQNAQNFGVFRRLTYHSTGRLGLFLVSMIILPALMAPWLPLGDPATTQLSARFLPIFTPNHVLGTDHLGREILARLVWGVRTSLMVGLGATLVAALFGTLIGLTSGYFGRWLDTVFMRSVDVLLAFPYLLLALAIVAALGPGLDHAMMAVAIVNIPFFARVVRGEVRRLKERDFVAAARLGGAGDTAILLKEILPNVFPTVVVMTGTTVGWMILETAGLSFLGLGAQPPATDLGSMLGESRPFLVTVPWVAVLPGLVVFVLVIGLNLLGDALRDLLDPRLVLKLKAIGKGELTPVTSAVLRPPQNEAQLLVVTGLTTYLPGPTGPIPVLDDIHLTLAPGERLGLVGESGSGKTMMLLSLLGLLPPEVSCQGVVRFQNRNLIGLERRAMDRLRGDRIGYVAQNPFSALDPLFPVGVQVAEAIRAHRPVSKKEARQQTLALLEQVHLPNPRRVYSSYPHQLSGGMCQRLVIAMSMANNPNLLVADEPTTALDVMVQSEILALLATACRERGAALLLVSHDLDVVAQLCDRVAVMYAGQVVEEAPLAGLLAEPKHPYTQALLACTPELGKPQKVLIPIPGEPPPLGRLEKGCRFAPRCSQMASVCLEGDVQLTTRETRWQVRCHRMGRKTG